MEALQVLNTFAASLGVTLRWDLEYLPEGCLYNKGVFAAGFWITGKDPDPRAVLHELAHWLVARKTDRGKPNYGLGPSPFANEPSPPKMMLRDEEDEYLAVQVEVLLAKDLFGDPFAAQVAKETFANPELSKLELESLVRRRVLRKDGSWGPEVTNAISLVNLLKS